jgi:DNA processing protein
VVVEAAASGGALITARYGFEQNRDVYALPGRIGQNTSAGCNALIRDSLAKLATHPQEILDDLELVFSPADQREEAATPALPFSLPDLPLSADEAKIINLLAAQGDQTIDQITQKTAIPTSVLNSLLLSMEFKGLVRQMPGKKFSLGKG